MLPLLLVCSALVACSNDKPTEEPPFFEANRFGSGPLTLEELNIRIPAEVAQAINAEQEACFYEAVERRAIAAGDPADLDPDEHVYWGGTVSKADWDRHSNHMQRVLLAQGVVSWAMIDCT
ncbi:MAG: hypothetical protein AAF660_15370 [Pseudomonadota bacterium]